MKIDENIENLEQEALYKTTTKITEQEMKNITISSLLRKPQTYIFIGCTLFIFYILLTYLLEIGYFLALVIDIIIVIFSFYLGITSRVKKDYRELKRINDGIYNIYFYKDRIRFSTKVSNSEYKYDLLYKIIETRLNFYIMLTDTQGIIVQKENCSNEMLEFIRHIK
ncbi:YcxB family protein [Peptostreptococcaceae bacterium OttesenSCG-928-C18]|nr:YcxB family protein [Peptostreptococcaceae bacterium OttesenSCG-928-C18]